MRFWLPPLALVLAILVLLSAVPVFGSSSPWPAFRNDVTQTGHTDSTFVPPRTNKTLWTFEKGGVATPAFAEDVVYLASMSDGLYALSANNGSIIWRIAPSRATYPFIIASSPTLADGRVFSSTFNNWAVGGLLFRNNVLFALNASNGKLLWNVLTEADMFSSPVYFEGKVFQAILDGTIIAVDAEKGKILWLVETDSSVWSTPAIEDGIVYYGTDSGQILGLDADTGEEVTRIELEGALRSSPSIADGVLYVGSLEGKFYAVDLERRVVLWALQTEDIILSSAAIWDGRVYIGSNEGTLYALDGRTGGELWSYRTDEPIWSSPTIVGSMLFIGFNDGSIRALELGSGKTLWEFDAKVLVDSSPAATDSLVFFPSRTTLYAFGVIPPEESLPLTTILVITVVGGGTSAVLALLWMNRSRRGSPSEGDGSPIPEISSQLQQETGRP